MAAVCLGNCLIKKFHFLTFWKTPFLFSFFFFTFVTCLKFLMCECKHSWVQPTRKLWVVEENLITTWTILLLWYSMHLMFADAIREFPFQWSSYIFCQILTAQILHVGYVDPDWHLSVLVLCNPLVISVTFW